MNVWCCGSNTPPCTLSRIKLHKQMNFIICKLDLFCAMYWLGELQVLLHKGCSWGSLITLGLYLDFGSMYQVVIFSQFLTMYVISTYITCVEIYTTINQLTRWEINWTFLSLDKFTFNFRTVVACVVTVPKREKACKELLLTGYCKVSSILFCVDHVDEGMEA